MSQFNFQRTFDFIKSIDKPGNVLVFFDFGKANDIIGFGLKPVSEFLLYETEFLTVRIGGQSSYLAADVLYQGKANLARIKNPKRFEMYFVNTLDRYDWATIVCVNQIPFESDKTLINECTKYCFDDDMSIEEIKEWQKKHNWNIKEKGLEAVADYIQIKGFALANIKPATHVMFDVYRRTPNQLRLVDSSITMHCYMSSRFRLKRAIRLYPILENQIDSLLWGSL